jgi:hypothetical protein
MSLDTMSVANVVCRFGEKVLLDYAREIVLPAFFDDKLIRYYKDSDYFFLDVELIELEGGATPTLGVAGRFVRDTTLKREQIFDGTNLVEDHTSIESSPSAFFCLILNNHKLIYAPETSHAPSVSSFGATFAHFLRLKHREYIDELIELLGDSERQLIKTHPKPKLMIRPLTNREEISKFVARFKRLQKLSIALHDTNDEVQFQEVFQQLREARTAVGAEKTEVVHRQKEGLDHANAVAQISGASETGNAEISLRGVDAEGNTLTGNNDSFKIAIPIPPLPADVQGAGKVVYGVFKGLVEGGKVAIDKIVDQNKVSNAIRKLIDG